MPDVIMKEEIFCRINKILTQRFGIDPAKLSENSRNENLLGRKYFLRSRDLLYLLFEIEREFGIKIPEEEIIRGSFSSIAGIADIIGRLI